jgi:hypothetical protein
MINAQAQLLKAGGSALALVGAAGKVASDLKDTEVKTEKTEGVDAKMAAKARKTAQMKIKTIQANKELSDKAKSRRIGKVLDEYKGGNK